jgi:hypothetical protein
LREREKKRERERESKEARKRKKLQIEIDTEHDCALPTITTPQKILITINSRKKKITIVFKKFQRIRQVVRAVRCGKDKNDW